MRLVHYIHMKLLTSTMGQCIYIYIPYSTKFLCIDRAEAFRSTDQFCGLKLLGAWASLV